MVCGGTNYEHREQVREILRQSQYTESIWSRDDTMCKSELIHYSPVNHTHSENTSYHDMGISTNEYSHISADISKRSSAVVWLTLKNNVRSYIEQNMSEGERCQQMDGFTERVQV